MEMDGQGSKNTRRGRGCSEGYLKEGIDRETIGVGHITARGGHRSHDTLNSERVTLRYC